MIGDRNLTRKERLVAAYRQGWLDGFTKGRTRWDWKALVVGMMGGFLFGLASGLSCWAFACR